MTSNSNEGTHNSYYCSNEKLYRPFQLGINAAFDEGEFTNIIEDNPLKVSQIKHRATIEVTKDGTVGAAASSIELVGLSAALDVPKNININKPFLFFVRDKELKAIVLAGKFSNPPDNKFG